MTARQLSSNNLRELLAGFAALTLAQDRHPSGLTLDSREVRAGDAFVALRGRHHQGRDYINDAISRGAVAVLVEEDGSISLQGPVPVIPVPDLRWRLGEIAARFHGHPSRALKVVGVTGTNGKTTVTHLIAQALNRHHETCALMGTLGQGLPDRLAALANTTPDAITVQKNLARWRDQGLNSVAMEVSSHGLDQGRVQGVRFAAAVLTNLTRDHLEYHGDMQGYAQAKQRLFTMPELGAAVLNGDDPYSATLLKVINPGVRRLAYALGGVPPRGAETITTSEIDLRDGIAMNVNWQGQRQRLRSPLLGRFNAANVLAAATALIALDVPLAQVAEDLAQAPGAEGRMQRLGGGAGQPLVLIDYAHTPDALQNVLQTSRELTRDALWCVFGCGGDRDPGKRPLMGRIASTLADHVIVTSDNPRGEPPQAIMDQIVAGMGNRTPTLVEADRRRAIHYAIANAAPGAVVVVAGKGHETHQEIAGRRWPFSDAAVAEAALRERTG
ncbi:MAG TPA: UDP-N-acetylmuramoyl-L-alanyl-D-glutamate--2,6-diaminopimelate ligase [Gammaproteobacteria bacterium]|nr:UDP-N-acetylmuramoyl-L-alanyl-D-glutamate--2,6-diaminopimelate ligase [Gammaproteobacteria bacterium]